MAKAKPLVLLKIPGGALSKPGELGFSREAMDHTAREILSVKGVVYLALLFGGFVHGKELKDHLGLKRNGVAVDEAGILATIMNAKVFQAFLIEAHGVRSNLFTPRNVHSPLSGEVYQEDSVKTYLLENIANGAVALLAGGMGEPGLRTDMAMVVRAYQLGAKVVLNGDPRPMEETAVAFTREHKLAVQQFDIRKEGAFKEQVDRSLASVMA